MSDTKIKEENHIEDEKEVKKRKFERVQSSDVVSTVRLPVELREKINLYCSDNRISFNAFVIMATNFFLKK